MFASVVPFVISVSGPLPTCAKVFPFQRKTAFVLLPARPIRQVSVIVVVSVKGALWQTLGAVHVIWLCPVVFVGVPSVPPLADQANVSEPPCGSCARTRKVSTSDGRATGDDWKVLSTCGAI